MHMINKLLEDAQIVMDQYEQERIKKKTDFNVFEILAVKEVLICRMLHALLDPKGSHGYGGLFLGLFLQKVLKQKVMKQKEDQEGFSEEEIDYARVTAEEPVVDLSEKLLPDTKRIDLYIRVGKRVFPIEVKLHAQDRECQCYDYYQYAKKTDPDTVIYYLTLDGHMPDEGSRNGLEIGKELRLISFEEEIRDWLMACLGLEQVQQCVRVKTIVEQFLDNINRMTGKKKEPFAMEIIKDFETFKTADVIAKSLLDVKTNIMKAVFKEIREGLEKSGYQQFYPDYIDKADKFYKQSVSTYPSLNYYLDEEKSLVLRIEADEKLYFGIYQWDKENNCVSLKTESNEEAVKTRIKNYMRDSEASYGWEYLPADNPIDFKNFSGSYPELFEEDKRKNIISKICKTVANVLSAMNALDFK